MKEAFFILLVFVVILILTAVRYRRQIAAVMQIWRTLKSVKDQVRNKNGQVGTNEPTNAGPLVNCAKCGTWVPEQRAIKLRGGVNYCSSACLETTGQKR